MSWAERRSDWQDEGVAGEYDARRFRTGMQKRKHANDARIVLRLLERAGSGLRVLDAPFGTGRMRPELVAAGHEVVGLDISRAMLAQSPDASAPRINGELERLPFADGAFDAAISMRFLFHVREPAMRARILGEFGRTCRWLVGHERERLSLKHRARTLRKRIGLRDRTRPMPSREELSSELAAAGWTMVAWQPVSRLFSDKALYLARRDD